MYSSVLFNFQRFNVVPTSCCAIVMAVASVVVLPGNYQLVNCEDNETILVNNPNFYILRHFEMNARHEENVDLIKYSTDLVKNLIKDDYNRNIRPHYGKEPEMVAVSILVTGISTISETEMEFEVDFYLRHYWNDPRLAFEKKYNLGRFALTNEFLQKIWMPDTYIVNGKSIEQHGTIRSDKATMLRIYHDGTVMHSTRLNAVLQCPMNLVLFPFDQQKCVITLGSFGYTDREVQFNWLEDRSKSEQHIYLPSFKILGYNTLISNATFITGNYSRIERQIFIERSIGYYVSQVYMPAFLIVVISWLPFWLRRNDHLERVALGITTVLTIITLITNTNEGFEKISYLKAIDIYLFVCFIMVFLSLIEFATVGYYETILVNRTKEKIKLNQKIKNAELNESGQAGQIRQTSQNPIQTNSMTSIDSENRMVSIHSIYNLKENKRSFESLISETSIIDHWARWTFPVSFIIFNVLYIVVIEILIAKYSLSDIYARKNHDNFRNG